MHKTTDPETAKRQSNYRGPECQQLGDVSRYMNTQMHACIPAGVAPKIRTTGTFLTSLSLNSE